MTDTIIIVCEHYKTAYANAIDLQGCNNIHLVTYPSLCLHRDQYSEIDTLFRQSSAAGDCYLFCATPCPVTALATSYGIKIRKTGAFDSSHIICDAFGRYLLQDGAYIATDDWISQWQRHLSTMGLTQQSARNYFNDNYSYLAILSSGMLMPVPDELEDLSNYVGLPYTIIPAGNERPLSAIQSLLDERERLAGKKRQDALIAELNTKASDYAVVFDIQLELMHMTKKRDIVDKLKQVFEYIFGARKFKFSSAKDCDIDICNNWPAEDNLCYIPPDQDKMFCKLEWRKENYGFIEASDFLTPEHIPKYLKLVLEIIHVAALLMHTSNQFEELEYRSYHDTLTKLYNRTYLKQFMSEHRDFFAGTVFAFDVDGLKAVNDTFGHVHGDRLLQLFSNILIDCFREEDILLRMGGDEFAAIVFETDEFLIQQMLKRIEKAVQTRNEAVDHNTPALSISVGTATGKEPSDTLTLLFREADKRMYSDKSRKRMQR